MEARSKGILYCPSIHYSDSEVPWCNLSKQASASSGKGSFTGIVGTFRFRGSKLGDF